MPNLKISEMIPVETLTGTERFPVVQDAITKQARINQITADLISSDPTTNITATNVQDAIGQLDSKKLPLIVSLPEQTEPLESIDEFAVYDQSSDDHLRITLDSIWSYISTQIIPEKSENYTLWSWGANLEYVGQLGLDDIINRSSPTQVGSLTDWNIVNVGADHGLAIKTDGTLWAWGSSNYGKLGLGNSSGSKSSPTQVGSLTDWHKINFNNNRSFSIKTDGTLWAWGRNYWGELGLNDLIDRSSPTQVGDENNWNDITNGLYHTIAIKNDGTLWSCGYGTGGQLGLGGTVNVKTPVQIGSFNDWYKISCGMHHSLAIKTDGTLWAWGNNGNGQLGLSDTNIRTRPVQVGLSNDWDQISCGYTHFTLAIKTDGTLWAWGYNYEGQLGLGNTNSISSPVQIGLLNNWKSVACGDYHVLAIKTDGTLWAWGYNNRGQLGLDNITSISSPVQIGSLTNWKHIDCGTEFSVAIQN